MSQYTTARPTKQTSTRSETNYEKAIVAGVQYENTEEAIKASALAMTRREKTSALALIAELGGDFDEKTIVQALYNTKKNFIVESIKNRASQRSIEDEIEL